MKNLVKGFLFSYLFISSVYAGGAVAPPEPARDILGIRIGMSAEAARTRLQKIGRFQREERKRHEVWEVRDPYFSHLVIQFDKAKLVHFVTAVAHVDAKRERMSYSRVAELNKARKKTIEPAKNNYRYEWELPAAGKNPKINIVAWGRHPQYLQYYSIERAN
ncbi:MAG: hypothetical protein LC803_10005 [Acidobacteria bacterium]|nr:hypothetical protein [Acidobacteriota bacterium]